MNERIVVRAAVAPRMAGPTPYRDQVAVVELGERIAMHFGDGPCYISRRRLQIGCFRGPTADIAHSVERAEMVLRGPAGSLTEARRIGQQITGDDWYSAPHKAGMGWGLVFHLLALAYLAGVDGAEQQPDGSYVIGVAPGQIRGPGDEPAPPVAAATAEAPPAPPIAAQGTLAPEMQELLARQRADAVRAMKEMAQLHYMGIPIRVDHVLRPGEMIPVRAPAPGMVERMLKALVGQEKPADPQ